MYELLMLPSAGTLEVGGLVSITERKGGEQTWQCGPLLPNSRTGFQIRGSGLDGSRAGGNGEKWQDCGCAPKAKLGTVTHKSHGNLE